MLDQLLSGKALTLEENASLFAAMLDGSLPDSVVAAVLTAWRLRGEGASELVAGARTMRAHATRLALPATSRPLVDNCGTGGDGSGSFNLSTAAAIVAASAGARVAKHGNRSVSSRCGSADLLAAAGLPLTLPVAAAGQLLAETGFTFFFAPLFHPLLARFAKVRQELGVRTVFNLLGPLANPITPEFQLIGVGARAYLRPMAEALAQLGVERALVVHSRDGLDEISPSAPTDALLVESSGTLTEMVIEPEAFGVRAEARDLAGGDASANLALLHGVLADASLPLAQAVALNAGAVLWLVGASANLSGGVALARQTLASGATREFFLRWLDKARLLAAASIA